MKASIKIWSGWKIIVTTTFALLLTISSYAMKPLNFGFKGGITSQSASLLDPYIGNYKLSTENRINGQVGVFARFSVVLLHVQPELLYTMNRYKLTATKDNERYTSIVKQNSLDIPVLFGVKLIFLRLSAGPVFNITSYGNTVKKDDRSPDVTSFTKNGVSYMVGAGLDIFHICIDVRYNGNIKSTQNIHMPDISAKEFNNKSGSWSFTMGLSF